MLCGCKVNSENPSLPPVSLRWVTGRNHGCEMRFYSTPHPKCQCWIERKHMNFKTFLSSSPAPLCVSNRRVKNRKILFTVRELKETEDTEHSFIGAHSDGEKPPTLLREIYLQMGLNLGSDLITQSGVRWEWATPLQDLPLVTSKSLFKPHSSLECARVARERQTEWRESFPL